MNFIPGRLQLQLDGTPSVLTDDGLRLPLGSVAQGAHGDRVLYGARPEHFTIDPDSGLSAEVIVVEPTGAETQVALRLSGQTVMTAFRDRISARPGDRLAFSPVAAKAHLFDAAGGERLN